jgi:hypothetical protein
MIDDNDNNDNNDNDIDNNDNDNDNNDNDKPCGIGNNLKSTGNFVDIFNCNEKQ